MPGHFGLAGARYWACLGDLDIVVTPHLFGSVAVVITLPEKPHTMSQQSSLDSHAVPFIPNPGEEEGEKVAVPMGWFNWKGDAPSDPDKLGLLSVVAWDVDGSMWD